MAPAQAKSMTNFTVFLQGESTTHLSLTRELKKPWKPLTFLLTASPIPQSAPRIPGKDDLTGEELVRRPDDCPVSHT